MINESAADGLTSDELQSLQGQRAAPSGEPPLRFVQQCQDWFKAWLVANKYPLDNGQVLSDQVLMFIFAEAPDIERPKFSAIETQWTRFFQGAHDQKAQGVILSNENFRTIHSICPTLSSLGDAFKLVVDHLTATDTFAIAQLSQRRLLFHLPGGNLEDWCSNPTVSMMQLSTQPLSADRIEADIEQFHKDSLLYATNPISQMVWRGKQHPYKLNPIPEQRIQSYLHLFLNASYKHLAGIVDEESRGKGGRCDIKVTWPKLGSPNEYTTTMLELKVLIEGKGSTYHRNWALSGITQAHRYRRADSEAVFACVFDARNDQADQMLDLNDVAKEKDVRLRRYLMEAPIDSKASGPIAKTPAKSKKLTTKKQVSKAAKKYVRKSVKKGSAAK
ncbi:hypothetical protein [Pseudoxanthomonas sacheonensis]|uniref:Uncharacterized protein n=1 Tax=Pseudoxanthomonas sacheonensis TaxID=443615 RepID=A0ABU1RRZ4_9GAMM|nr:hypothetical protein [Pseudoxanthomonas sacheonensis]MDR6841552.1 hypothetical protein [Pseudoxanthomonas sacheonensis]